MRFETMLKYIDKKEKFFKLYISLLKRKTPVKWKAVLAADLFLGSAMQKNNRNKTPAFKII